MMPVHFNTDQMGKVAKRLLGSGPLPELQAHSENPANKRRFEEWQKRREANAGRSQTIPTACCTEA